MASTIKTLALAAILLATGTTALAQDQVVRIGVSGPLSGSNAFAGKDDENGVRLAVEELNAQKLKVGGKTLKFELLSEDDQGDPKAGVSVAQKFADAGVKFVLGPYNSGVAIPASRVYNDAGILMSTVGTSPKITQARYPNVFRIVASDAQVGASMASYAARELKIKTVGVIDDRTAFGQGIADEFAKQARASGVTVVGREFTNDKASDFSAILTAFRAKKVDAIFFGGYAPQGAPMARQMKQLGMANVRLLGGDTLCSPEMAKLGGDAVGENVMCAQAGATLDKQANGPAFKARYKQRYQRDPDVYAPAFYDQTMFIARAMQAANTTDAAAVGKQLHTMSYQGVAGTYGYDASGNLKKTAVTVYTFKGGQLAPLANY
ncbi:MULTISPECIES: branched-chain amino acid ABC transporter substrate-binding protein [Massilia]|jgi:ABC-type branched-subunit amino acid transport system substrate-binding protein|uniref:ABC transporter substrate-binding protein n=2 Tax=Massilia TaxID=149698 RepID=A0A7X3FWI9_9BURK|nr:MULTISPECIES: branched-chain amino acid ABC transporter substrate-binding protein [Telluria group]KQY10532.1 ABC transporter substrate-binding protein [Massilia sp. Root133]KQZ47537.1 ABC transporter substrate-binding protein [Massilia sp. Root1485]MDN4045766.1 branched-chain amino acid ABC transporter substrate-binding protein [Massilia sp. YIM B02787]MVW58709.1 ABC transporter substrate-binding protein [Telluria cellulosilytica]